MPFVVGERVDRYELVEQLGAGGQGSVWRARDLLPPHVERALKLIPMPGITEAALERSRREARLLAELRHPALVRCHGLFESYERDVVGLVLDFAEGTNLLGLLKDVRFDAAHRRAALRQIAEALAYLHGEGLVHRDVKLENVVVTNAFWQDPTAPGTVRLVDFGISAAVGNPQGITDTGHVVGTLSYMAPEIIDPSRWSAPPAAPAIDVFALGVLGWLLLYGRHPTGLPVGASTFALAASYVTMDPNGPDPGIPDADRWDVVLRQCVAPRADARPADGRATLRLLDGTTAPLRLYTPTPSGTAPATVGHAGPSTDPGSPPHPEALRLSIPQPTPSSGNAQHGARTSSPVVHPIGHHPVAPRVGQQASTPRASMAPLVVALIAVAGTLGAVALGGAAWLAATFPTATSTTRDPPPAYTRTTSVPTTPPSASVAPPPPSTATAPASVAVGCACALPSTSKGPCPSLWKMATRDTCKKTLPDVVYRVRLSHVDVAAPGEKPTNLFLAEPGSQVCFKLTGKQQEECVDAAALQSDCGASHRLSGNRWDLQNRGFDVRILRGGRVLTQGHVGAHTEGLLQSGLCQGVLHKVAGWGHLASTAREVVGFEVFLDPHD